LENHPDRCSPKNPQEINTSANASNRITGCRCTCIASGCNKLLAVKIKTVETPLINEIMHNRITARSNSFGGRLRPGFFNSSPLPEEGALTTFIAILTINPLWLDTRERPGIQSAGQATELIFRRETSNGLPLRVSHPARRW